MSDNGRGSGKHGNTPRSSTSSVLRSSPMMKSHKLSHPSGPSSSCPMVNPWKEASRSVSQSSGYSRSTFIPAAAEDTHGPIADGTVKILATIDTPEEIISLRYTLDSKHVAVGHKNGAIRLYNPSTLSCVYSLNDSDTLGDPLPVTCLRAYPTNPGSRVQNIITASYATGFVKKWHYTTGQCVSTLKEDRQVLAIANNPQGDLLATVGSNPKVNVYSEETQQLSTVLAASSAKDVMDGHRSRVFAVLFHPINPHELVTGGWDNTIQFWDMRSPHAIRRIYGTHICGEGLDIDTKGKEILTASWQKDHTLQIFDYATGNLIHDVKPGIFSSFLYCGQWLGRDMIVVGGTSGNLAHFLDKHSLTSVGCLRNLSTGVYSLDNNRRGNVPHVAVSSKNKVYILESWR